MVYYKSSSDIWRYGKGLYLFGMVVKRLIGLFVLCGSVLCLTACSQEMGPSDSEKSVTEAAESETWIDETSTETSSPGETVAEIQTEAELSVPIPLSIRSRRVIAPCSEWELMPSGQVISSRAELDAFYEEYKTLFDFSTQWDMRTDDAKNVDDLISTYDETWFMDHQLIVRPILAPSSGNLYEVTEAVYWPEAETGEDGVIRLSVETQEEMLVDLSVYTYLLFVEVDGHEPENDVKLELTFKELPLVGYEHFYYLEPEIAVETEPLPDLTLIRSVTALNEYMHAICCDLGWDEESEQKNVLEERIITYDEEWFKGNHLIAVWVDLSAENSVCRFDRILFDKEKNEMVIVLRRDAEETDAGALSERGLLLVESGHWKSILWHDEEVDYTALTMRVEVRR